MHQNCFKDFWNKIVKIYTSQINSLYLDPNFNEIYYFLYTIIHISIIFNKIFINRILYKSITSNMISIVIIFIFSLNSLEINILSFLWNILLSKSLYFCATSKMNCKFLSIFTSNLNYILCNFNNFTIKYF